jgi:hypothetical protein
MIASETQGNGIEDEGDDAMILKTRVSRRDMGRRSLALLIVLGISCAFVGRVQAATSGQLQVFDPFAMKLTSVVTTSATQGVIRVSADIRNVASRAAVGQATTGRGVRQVGNDDQGNLRKPAIRIPYKPRFRSPFAPPGFPG